MKIITKLYKICAPSKIMIQKTREKINYMKFNGSSKIVIDKYKKTYLNILMITVQNFTCR